MKIFTLFVAFVLACFALSQRAQGVVPPPPGGYPNFTTAAGDHALQALTLGLGNTAIGTFSLFSATTGNFNTAVGAGALDLNTADSNTATGAAALLFNTTGTENTANGTAALEFNDAGSQNTANGAFALFSNTAGNFNTATGAGALQDNTGSVNTATGFNALLHNNGGVNTAIGAESLEGNTTGSFNTACGADALDQNTTGMSNIALGQSAGSHLTTGDNNIDIGNTGETDEASTIRIGQEGNHTNTYIAGISGVTVAGGVGVIVDSLGHLGTVVSSERFKDAIKPMDKASEAILALKPVTFQYKKELDPKRIPQFGLVAEEVEKVNPDLVARDAEGKVYTVRYEAVNAMLLNEFLKEHRKVEDQQATITDLKSTVAQQQKDFQATAAEQQKQIEALTAGLQKINAEIEASKAAPQMVNNP
jgi:hypothetical protein